MITKNQVLTSFSQIKKHIGSCCFLVMLLLMSGTSWAQTCYNLSLGGGSYTYEASWQIIDNEGEVVAEGSDTTVDLEVCLADACYTLNMADSWGDGWNGNDLTIVTADTLVAPVVVAGPFTLLDGFDGSVEFALGEAVCATDCPDGNFGDPCDDDNDSTFDDVIGEDCSCAGTPYPEFCLNTSSFGSANILEDGPNGQLISISSCSYQEEYSTISGVPVGADLEFSIVEGGYITVRSDSLDGEIIAEGYSPLSVFNTSGANLYSHWNVDENCVQDDACVATQVQCTSCESDCPDGNIGNACDDGIDATYDDELGEDCLCAGIPYDCTELLANIGDECDDNDSTTLNDVVGEDCGCTGEPSQILACGPYSNIPNKPIGPGSGVVTRDTISVSGTSGQTLIDLNVALSGTHTWHADMDVVLISPAGTQIELFTDICSSGNNFDVQFDDDGAVLACQPSGSEPILYGAYAPEAPALLAAFNGESFDGDWILQITDDTNGDGGNLASWCLIPTLEQGFDCPDLEANIGDACDDENDDTENDIVGEDCTCSGTPVFVSSCEDFVYYISDHAAADGISDIYEVTISGGVATMEYIATSDIEIHIAYNNEDNLIYAVSKNENSYRTISPHEVAPSFGPTIALGADYGELTAAVFAPNGNLLIGSQDNNAVYSVNVSTNVVSSYDTYAPVTGGDLAFASDGMLYLATRSGNGLYEVYPADVIADVFIGNVTNLVTGMAITDTDQLVLTNRGNTSLEVRNLDGSNPGTTYSLALNGEPYTLRDGDMTSGCNTFSQPGEGECLNYKLYYVHIPQGGGQEPLLEVTLNGDGTASYTTVMPDLDGHIGLSPDGGIIYNVDGSNLKIVDVASASVIATIDIISDGGVDLSGFVAAVVSNDGTLYVGHTGSNQVYTVNPATGIATPYGPSRTVNGGDLIEVDGEIWLITRNNNTFTNVLTGASFTVPVNEINGAAVLTNGNVLLADGNGGSLLKEVEIASQSVVATHDIGLPLFNGDLAGACIESGGLNTQCYGSEILGFEQGLQTNGNAVPLDRSDATAALGQPDASNAAGGFVSLGEGGSITIGFGGVIYDAPGNDIRIWETSFSGDACGGADDEQADIELSQDGINFVSAGSICRDGEVDIAGTGLDYVAAIRITNSASTGSLDGYDVDGVEAINGCENNPVVENGDCYATEVVEYVQGTSFGGGAIAANRTNPAEALGAPERSNQSGDLVFVSLGYGGSLTLSFDGAIPNGDGDDIEVVETTWGNNSCNSYDEFADVYVSVSGEPGDWHMVKTICRADNFVDISDAGDGTLGLEYVNYVKIVNNNDLSNTPDAFDVDGVVALYNCEDGQESQGMAAESNSVLSSYPNPTSGPSQVVFMTAETGRTLVEVYDMSGRMVTTLFNAEAQQGEEYRIDFDGASLPNGVYIYKMTTTNETIIDKFMIAK